ncbi:winged helix-turn-helix domain-containing protein [Serratia fonticola]|uniref:winged helix-turn-helix domain-containing protein n=1 Tax=Serratia fonticola TaxID=47917 RepID=UPI001648930A|nr:winged helix-turn-helix domain-containing protein [Serratia fonticola]MBC3217501.1 winged helix-turn-helix domain-containing protein [Serratia fonticola]
MKYILNYTVVFLPSERTISMLNNEEVRASLSAPATRLLLELIKHSGVIVTRETLLKNVWEDYGFSGSNSNLNSYISEIRKTLALLGFNERIILTIPKQGLKLEANIETSIIQPSQVYSDQIEIDKVDGRNETSDTKDIQIYFKIIRGFLNKSRMKKIDMILVSLFFLACVTALGQQHKNRGINIQGADIRLLTNYKKCNIFSIEDYDIYPKERTIALALDEIEKKNINCNDVAYDVYFAKKMLSTDENYLFSFLGTCLLSGSSKHTYCKSRSDNNGS